MWHQWSYIFYESGDLNSEVYCLMMRCPHLIPRPVHDLPVKQTYGPRTCGSPYSDKKGCLCRQLHMTTWSGFSTDNDRDINEIQKIIEIHLYFVTVVERKATAFWLALLL